MKKIFKRIIIIVVALFMTYEIATSLDYWVGDYKCHFIISKGVVIITGYRGDGDAYIPSEILGFRVTEVDEEVFKDNDDVTSITISKDFRTDLSYRGLDFEYNMLVENCNNLKSIKFEEGSTVTDIDVTNCHELTEVTFPDGMERLAGRIVGCEKLGEVSIPDTVWYIEAQFFCNTKFEKEHEQDDYYVAGDGVLVFYNGSEGKEVVIPKGIKTVGDVFTSSEYEDKLYFAESIQTVDTYLGKEDIAYFGNETFKFIDLGYYCEGTVVAPAGSPMAKFCEENNINFKAMTEEEEAIWREKTEAPAEITYQN